MTANSAVSGGLRNYYWWHKFVPTQTCQWKCENIFYRDKKIKLNECIVLFFLNSFILFSINFSPFKSSFKIKKNSHFIALIYIWIHNVFKCYQLYAAWLALKARLTEEKCKSCKQMETNKSWAAFSKWNKIVPCTIFVIKEFTVHCSALKVAYNLQ